MVFGAPPPKELSLAVGREEGGQRRGPEEKAADADAERCREGEATTPHSGHGHRLEKTTMHPDTRAVDYRTKNLIKIDS